jgi:hypothetical protein
MSTPYTIRRLPKTSLSSQKENLKYYLSYCKDKINTNNPNTNGWINIIKTLKFPTEDFDKSRVLLARLEKHKDIVVKLSDDESIKREYEYGKKLSKIKGFVKFICYFECNDNFLNYPNGDRNHLCNGPGSQMKIIVMPHYEMGNIGSYGWTRENLNILRTCMKHAFLTYTDAFFNGYLHGDFHPGNVLLKNTKDSSLEYSFEGIDEAFEIETNGVRTWIMDFENTKNVRTDNPMDIMNFYFDAQKFFNTLTNPRFIRNAKEVSVMPVMKTITKYMNYNKFPSREFIRDVLCAIDKIDLV